MRHAMGPDEHGFYLPAMYFNAIKYFRVLSYLDLCTIILILLLFT